MFFSRNFVTGRGATKRSLNKNNGNLYHVFPTHYIQFYFLFIYQQAICARRNLQFNSCASQSLKIWGYCSHVKATSYSIAIKTKHWQTKFVSPHQRIICWAFKEEKGVAERRINCIIIPKYNETQQKSYIHWVRLYFLINWPSCFRSELTPLQKKALIAVKF